MAAALSLTVLLASSPAISSDCIVSSASEIADSNGAPQGDTRQDDAINANQPESPDRKSKIFDSESVVLPGFDSVRVEGCQIKIGERVYDWSRGYLPVRIESRGREIVGPVELIARRGQESISLRPDEVRIVDSSPTHAVVLATGEPIQNLEVAVETRVEYDGLAVASIYIVPSSPVPVDALELSAVVRRFASSQVVAFDANQIRNKELALFDRERYAGPLVNVFGFPDGESSFWIFTEDAAGWALDESPVTRFERADGRYLIRHGIINHSTVLKDQVRAQIGLLATPIRQMPPAASVGRVVPRPTKQYEGLGKYHLWWITAFPHQDAPFLSIPLETRHLVPPKDHRAYPGVEKNRKLLERWRSWGIERLPYFSGHCLSEVDSILEANLSSWVVEPRMSKRGDAPYVARVQRPWLSHRASQFTDYMIGRWGSIIDELGIEGVYFDQGRVIDSSNPHHGGWVTPSGRREGSLDILGNRAYLKRLRTIFHRKGKAGHIFTHVSGVEIIPAYTFATSIVVGENFRGAVPLVEDDYASSISVDDTRALFSSHQFGLPITWLPQLWAKHRDSDGWKGSQKQVRGVRSLLSLALLHDTLVWPPNDWSVPLYAPIWREFDRFSGQDTEFFGYWSGSPAFATDQEGMYASYYLRGDEALVVVANLDQGDARVRLGFDRTEWMIHPDSTDIAVDVSRDEGAKRAVVLLPIPRHDFMTVRMMRVIREN